MRRFVILIAAGLAVIAAYANSLHNSFHFDDGHVIENNLYIRSLSNVPRYFVDADTFSSLPQNATYRPLVTLTLAIDYHFAHGLDPLQYHVTQILLLLILAALLVLFYRDVMQLAGVEAPWIELAAIFSATLFAVHTGNTETMNLISARSELIAAIGVVGAFLMYIELPALRRFGLFLIPMILGGLAKAPVVVFAPMLLVFIVLFEEVPLKRALVRCLPIFAVCIALVTFLAKMNDPRWSSGGGDRFAYARTQPWVWLHYFRMFFIPLGFTADTDQPALTWWDTRFWSGIAFLVLLGWAIARTTRERRLRPAAFGLWWFAIALVPTSSFFPLAEMANDHRLFFPFIGLTLSVVWLAVLAAQRYSKEAAIAAASCVLIAMIAGTHVRNRAWRSEETLWYDVTLKSPMNGRGLMNYALTLMEKGKLAEARAIFQRAEAFNPNYWTLEINLGIVNGALGDQPEAERHFKRALELHEDADGHYFYGRWLIDRGRGPEAVTQLRRALEIVPAGPSQRNLLMQLLYDLGDTSESQRMARQSLAIVPGDGYAMAYAAGRPAQGPREETYDAWFHFGANELVVNNDAAAAGAFRHALELQPASAAAANNLGWSLLELGFKPQAAAAFREALRLRPGWQLAQNNLASAETASPR